VGVALTEWEYDLTWTEREDPDHEFMPILNKKADGERACGQRVREEGNTWYCTRPASPQHRQHIAHCGKLPSHDHEGDCARMAWTGPLSEV
jgi:hypothetical protein